MTTAHHEKMTEQCGSTNSEDVQRRFIRFSFYNSQKADRHPRYSDLRDGDAACELTEALYDLGYRNGGVILNYPCPRGAKPVEFECSSLRPYDMLLLTTRPPLSDDEWPGSKRIYRSYSELENRIFGCLHEYFTRCTRSQVILSNRIVRSSPRPVASRANIQFRQRLGAAYDRYAARGEITWHRPPDGVHLTAAFLVYSKEVWPGGPALLAAFGMGETETLGWAHLLKTKYRGLICTREFVMAEMVVKTPGQPPADISFVDDWDVAILSEPTSASSAT